VRDTVSRGSTHKHTLHHTHTHTHSDSYSLFLCVSCTQRCKRARKCVCMRGHVGVSSRTCKRATVSVCFFFVSRFPIPSLCLTSAKSDCMKATWVKSCARAREMEKQKNQFYGGQIDQSESACMCVSLPSITKEYTQAHSASHVHTLSLGRVFSFSVSHTPTCTHMRTHILASNLPLVSNFHSLLPNTLPLFYLGEVGLYEGDVGE